MSKYEFVHEMTPFGPVHKTKITDKKTGEEVIFRHILETPIDRPLCEIIEEFGIPIIRIPGKQYKIRYVAPVAIRNALNLKRSRLDYAIGKITWIHSKEKIEKKEYNKQIPTQLGFALGGKALNLVSIADTIQILSILQNDKEKERLIRKLIIKLEELQERLNKQQKEEIENLREILEKLDDIAYDWIKEHGIDKFHGYEMLWETTIWDLIINVHYRIRQILGLPVPKRENTGFHHSNRPYYKVYPHIATKGRLVDKRFDHTDPRQKIFY